MLRAPCLQDDFDIDAEDEASLELKDRPEVKEKLARRIEGAKFKQLHEPRPGKKCLVLGEKPALYVNHAFACI